MYDDKQLRGAIYRSGQSPRHLSETIGMTEKTFYRKLNRGNWYCDEAKQIAKETGMTKEEAFDIFLS